MGGDTTLTGRPRWRRRPLLLGLSAIAVAVIVVLVGTMASLWLTRDTPGARSIEDALAEFRNGDPTAIESLGPVVRRPEPGVYLASGNGRASIDFPPTSQSYGVTIPVLVRYEPGDCWTTEVDFNDAFRQTWFHCLVDGDVVERANRTSTRWDLGVLSVQENAVFDCDPPGVIIRSGERRTEVSRYTCTGTSDAISGGTTSEVEYSMVGAEPITIDGVVVPTFHYSEVDTLTGAQRGTTTIDYWYSIESFLLVRMERSIRLRTDSPVGTVTYTENGSWQLESLLPRR